jgi:hypothetical protein
LLKRWVSGCLQDADGWRLGGAVGYGCAVARVSEDLLGDC